ncbi:MAG TPA: phosphotransferase family protein [Acidimicrobiales bacterium]|nr:phosphotransferase family protein [Acidimicrobiales bacterium]
MSEIEGIDGERVSAWFTQNIPGSTPPLTFDLIAGGRSNLTFKVTDSAGREYVLRRPPTSHVLPTAHDMAREHRIIAALQHTPVPVAPPLGFCDDESVNGRPFYVMEYVEGHVLRDAPMAEKLLDEHARRTAGESLVDVLLDIHAVDVDAVGLGELGRREGYIERQLKRWYGQFKQSNEMTGRSVPVVDEVYDFLSTHIPAQGPAAIVHGDYRLDNTILGEDGRVRAVLDWEICTLGDPLADLGLLMVYWSEPEDDSTPLGSSPTTAPGFARRAELVERYAKGSDRDLSKVDFYVAFGYWKLACILEGVYARYAGGAMGGDRSGFEAFAEQVGRLAQAAKESTTRL